jgi:hypothetical protein
MSEEQNKSSPDLVTVFSDLFRSVARPAVTIIFAAVIAQVVIEGTDVPEWFLGLAIPCITWWFAERTVTHIKENKTSPSTGEGQSEGG